MDAKGMTPKSVARVDIVIGPFGQDGFFVWQSFVAACSPSPIFTKPPKSSA